MGLTDWVRRLAPPPPPDEPAASISPDSVVVAQESDSVVLDLVGARTLELDQALVAQIRARLRDRDSKETSNC
jgi:hypothetical protein